RPSLGVAVGRDGKVLLNCGRGCTFDAIVGALGLSASDLFPKDEVTTNGARPPRIVATYDYTDEAGCLLYQVVRHEPKDFRQRRRDGKAGWAWNLNGVSRVLYRLPEVLNADPAATIWIVEGEKDVETLRAEGLVATTNPQGAGKWRPD